MTGYIFVILTVVFWGVAPLFDKMAVKDFSVFKGVLIRSTVVFIILFISSFFRKDSLLEGVFTKNALYFVISGILASILGMLTYYAALKHLPTSKVVPLCSIYPLVAALLSFLILKEGVTPMRIAGVILIVSGIWLVKIS